MRQLLTALCAASLFAACGGESAHDGNGSGNHAGSASGGTSGTSGSAGHGTGGSGAAGHGTGGTSASGGTGGDLAGLGGTGGTSAGRAGAGGSGGDIAGRGGSGGDFAGSGGTGGDIAGRGGSAGTGAGTGGFGGRNCGPLAECGGGNQGGTAGGAGRSGCGTGLECAGRGQGGSTSTQTCGGLAGTKCPSGMYCDYSDCTLPDAAGVCITIGSEQCDTTPVCGCDGKAYSNACRAHSAGVDTTTESACIGGGDSGNACIVDDDCGSGLKCCSSPLGVLTCMTPAGNGCPLLP